jgi:hypothetical protein
MKHQMECSVRNELAVRSRLDDAKNKVPACIKMNSP